MAPASAEERLAITLDSIGDAVITTDSSGCVERMNPVAERLTGWKLADARGLPVEQVFHIINEDTRQPVASPVARVLREGIVVGLANHTALVARDGVERAIADSGAPIRDAGGEIAGVVLVFRDVSAERAAEDALRVSEERFRLLVDSVNDYAIFMLDPEGRVVTWNLGARRINGYEPHEIIGQHLSRFYPPEDVAAGRPANELAVATAEGRYEEEGWRVRKDGTRFRAHVVLTAMRDARGVLRGFAKVTRDLTERRRAEEIERELIREQAARAAAEAAEKRVRESEERYRESSEQLDIILRGVADGITVQDRNGRIIYANDAAARACGLPDAEMLLATPPEQLLSRFDMLDEEGRPVDPARLPGRLALAGTAPPPTLLRIRDRATGQTSWSSISASAVRAPDGQPYLAVNIWHDVTERRRAEESARFLSSVSEALAHSLDYEVTLQRVAQLAVPHIGDWVGVEVLQPDGALRSLAVAHVDPAKVEFARELQRRYPPDPTASQGAPEVIRTRRSELHREITDEMLVAGAVDEEHLRIARELGLRSAMIVPLLARGRALGAMTFVAAESGRVYGDDDLLLAEEVGRRAGLAVDNARLYREAQEAVRARDEFLSIASHELRTPCTTLQLQLESMLRVLADRPEEALSSGRVDRNVRRALAQTTRLNHLVEELLDVSRVAAGRLRIEREEVDLALVVREATARFAHTAEEAGCELTLRFSGTAHGRWDRTRLDQVVTNLLANAVKYGRGRPVEVALDGSASDSVRLVVRDQGIGISSEDQARIFEPFERAVSVRHYGGFGLGLWITRKIVEGHGGTISVASAPDAGATFTVELPRAEKVGHGRRGDG